MSHTYRPRWSATLKLSATGNAKEAELEEKDRKVYTIPVKVASATLIRNDHNQADTLSLTCDWQNIGLDPRLIRNANVEFHLGSANEYDEWKATTSGGRSGSGNLRFIGTVTEIERVSEEQQPYEVTIQATDFTEFFLRAKPFGSLGIPELSMTLEDAWRRIVSQTPGAEQLADKLEVYEADRGILSTSLADLVDPRYAKLTRVTTQPETDAWAVWQSTVTMCSLVSFVYLNKVIVTTVDSYYRTNDPPVFRWGENIWSIKERRNLVDFTNGVGLTAFDPATDRMIEAVFPPRDQLKSPGKGAAAARKRISAPKQTSSDPEARLINRYDWSPIRGPMGQQALNDLARRAFLERSKQELQGILSTSNFLIPTRDGGEFQFLDFAPGDLVIVSANENGYDDLKANTVEERKNYLVSQGYDADAAEIIAIAMDNPLLAAQPFYVKSFSASVGTDAEGGNVDFELNYCNQVLT